MAIVIRNDKPQGRFFRYRVNGAPASVWVDGFSEVVIPELNDTSTMLNKVEKAKQERVEQLSNAKSISRDLFISRAKIFKNVSEEIRWKPVVVRLQTGFDTYVFEKEGRKFVFASPPGGSLTIGSDIRGSRLNTLGAFYNGVYTYNGLQYTINASEIVAISDGENSTALTWNCVNVTYTATSQIYSAYTTGSTNIYDNGAQWFNSSAGTGTVWGGPFGGFHYSGGSVYVINVNSSGIVNSSSVYSTPVESSSILLYNQLGTASYTRYYDSGDNPLAVNTQFYTDEDLTTVWNTNTTVKYDVPASSINRLLGLSTGRVSSVTSYTNGGVKTLNLSGNTATTTTAYVQSTQTIDQVSVYWFADTELLSIRNVTGTYIDFSQDPNRYIQVSGGRVLASGDINWGGGGITYQGWTVRDSKSVILTIYTQQGSSITTIGVFVYANNDGTGSVTNGNYTYNDAGTNKTITISGGRVTNVQNAGR